MSSPPPGGVAMESDEEFQKQLALFHRCFDDGNREENYCIRLVHDLPRREHFLDVGAGSGRLAASLSPFFVRTTVLEPGAAQARSLQTGFPHFRVLNSFFEQADLGDDRFDFILCSHVLYYVAELRWLAFAQKMVEHLGPGGVAVISMQAPADQCGDFTEHFTGRRFSLVPLWDRLVTSYGDEAVAGFYYKSVIRANSLEDMTRIGCFLLCDRRFQERADEVASYLEQHNRTASGFVMHQGNMVLTVRRL
jgi:SAM-dependent methyltransferase